MTQPLELTTDLVLTAHVRDDPAFAEVRSQYEQIKQAMVEFQAKVWDAWLQRGIGTSGPHSFESQSEDVHLLAFATAGRIMITLHRTADSSRHVTMMGAQKGDQAIGLQGILMTADQAVAVLKSACGLSQDLWNGFRASRSVTIAGL
jgi:hypothetical protein